MNAPWIVEADILRIRRQLGEVRNPEPALVLRSKLMMLQYQLDSLKAVSRT
jgi:hypothetical protein